MSDIEPIAGSSTAASNRDVLMDSSTSIDPAPAAREGLPRGYRMRADSHYVDHLGSQSAGPPVRMIAVDQLASPASFDSPDLRPLVESIRVLGVVHPLLVCRRDTGYGVIAGHKRLAAAQLLRLPAVPCLVHHVDEAQAALLARADNLLAASPTRPDPAASMTAGVQQAIAQHLAAVQTSAALISTAPPHLARTAVDFIAASAWRAAQLAGVLDVLSRRSARKTRARVLAGVIDHVIDGFSAEGRLNGVDVRARIDGAAAGIAVQEQEVALIISSGVLATLPLVDQGHVDQPAIVVAATNGAAGSARIIVGQTAAPAPAALAGRFFDEDYNDRAGGWVAVACALAVRIVAERAGGAAAFEVDSQGHTSLVVQFPHA